MKKVFILFSLLLTLLPAFAQTEENIPNRILVTNQIGGYTGFKIDNIDKVSFAKVDGEVLANITIDQVVSTDTLIVSIDRTPECMYYKLAVIPQVTANQLTNELSAIRYINSLPSGQVPVLYQDFDQGLLTGIELNANSDYSIFTIGVDRFGVEAGVARAEFSTPAPPIVGNPHVDAEIVETTLDSFTLYFTPNEDVYVYYLCAGEKGTMQSQYEMWGPMFGFSNFAEMIKMWGEPRYEAAEVSWTQMNPNTEYEVFIAMEDANGNFAPVEVVEVSTLALGGPGEASVDIEVVDFSLTDWYGEMEPTLTVSFTPNDQASCYRTKCVNADYYAENKDAVIADLCSDPWMPTSYWFNYGPAVFDYKVTLGTEVVVLAAAKNVNNEWGPVNEVYYTTPDELEGYEPAEAPAKVKIQSRVKGSSAQAQSANVFGKGVMPALKAPAKLELRAR